MYSFADAVCQDSDAEPSALRLQQVELSMPIASFIPSHPHAHHVPPPRRRSGPYQARGLPPCGCHPLLRDHRDPMCVSNKNQEWDWLAR